MQSFKAKKDSYVHLLPGSCILYHVSTSHLRIKSGCGGSRAVADPENFGGGDLKHKTSKIRMSSPKLRVIFRPNSEIQTFFSPKFKWSPNKKKKKVFTKIESDFSAELGNSNVFFAQIQVVSKKKKVFTKIETDFSPDSLRLGRWGGCIPKWSRIIRNRG